MPGIKRVMAIKNNKAPPTLKDKAVIERIYHENKGVMLSSARKLVSSDFERDEVIHDALLVLLDHAGSLAAMDDKACRVYVAAVVRNVALKRAERTRTEKKYFSGVRLEDLELPASEPTPEERCIDLESQSRRLRYLREALDELEESDRELLLSRYVLGESTEQIARRLGIAKSSVRMKLTRARRRARAIIERKEGSDAV